ncbi:unnamed protein product [Caenorhabditis bovis]|uniref:BTB domain-containing protein n=1 Tax=Caenorhabditis bovis TaxID=2654633 RepID=A0A8S1ETV9_9PELO|nr:unnamed protein product [Caenorhabditis bovis]
MREFIFGCTNFPKPYNTISLCTEEDDDSVKVNVSDAFFKKIYKNFNDLRSKCQLCDTVLIVENRRLSAHKVVLAAAIPYFNGMFTCHMIEEKLTEISLPYMQYDVVEKLVNFVYTGELAITTNNVQSLMMGASFFQLMQVVKECSRFLVQRLHHTNCLSIYEFFKLMGAPKWAITKAVSHVIKYFLVVSRDEEFLKTPLETILDLLSYDGLYVDSEEDVFLVAINWLEADESRHGDAAKVLSRLRLPLLRPCFLADMAEHPILKNDPECQKQIELVREAMLHPERRKLLPPHLSVERTCYNVPSMIVVLGGLMPAEGSKSSVEIFEPSEKMWKAVKEMVTLRSRIGVAVHKRQVYTIGGFDGQDRLTVVEVFDYDTSTWFSLPPLKHKRSALGAAFLEKKLYVCGGYDGIESLRSVEVYDLEQGYWKDGVDMYKQRSAAGVAVLHGELYVCGGHDGFQVSNSVEKYNPILDKWIPIPGMKVERARLGAATYKGKLYVAGGFNGNEFLRSVEVYDPRTGSWSFVESMKMKRSRVALVANVDGLYAIGGFDGSTNLCSVEKYDVEKDTWTIEPSMATHEGGVGVGMIPIPPHLLS